jgi:large subunit ribosomal protein L3
MAKHTRPRRGSLGFLPLKRARKQNPSVSSWSESKEAKPLGFAGYKAGMVQVKALDPHKESPSYNQTLVMPATIIECPPLKVKKVRTYQKTPYGLKLIPKKDLEKNKEKVFEVRVQVTTTPPHKKKTESFEIKVGGEPDKALEYAQSLVGKELKAEDVLKAGDFIDVIAVTKGKGIQGPVKRRGVKIQGRKAKGKRRHAGVINPWKPAHTMWTAPMGGQTGYHRRTFLNKQVLSLGENGEDVSKQGIPHYGKVKSNYVLVKGSVPGSKKRLVMMRLAVRPPREKPVPEFKEVINQ